MDLKKIIKENGLSNFPAGLGGCRAFDMSLDSCDYDVWVFDGVPESMQIISCDNEFAVIHHASLSETSSEKLLQYHKLKILQDESWDLHMLLSKIAKKQTLLFSDFAKNSLIESQFCCQKTIESIKTDDVFAPCWQKSAIFYLAKAISSINHLRSSPSHMLDLLRKVKKNQINEHIATVTQTVGIERATPILLERMLKSTMGFSDLIEKNSHSQIIKHKHDFFVKNSMLSDCYFYLSYVNHENFMQIKDTVSNKPDLFHILKTAFDIEANPALLEQQSEIIQKSCNEIQSSLGV